MRLVPLVLAAVLAVLPARAAPAGQRGTYRRVELPVAPPLPAGGGGNPVIFLDRCVDGCTISPGSDDSRTSRSSIVSGTTHISEFDLGDQAWDVMVTCVNDVYEPYGVAITDVDPGDAPHFRSLVAGSDSEFGIDAGGVAPLACGVIPNAITFVFANSYSSDPIQICAAVAQETAHAFGLEHELLCEDPMTYLTDCPTQKYFQDADAQCGEFSARQCECGGTRQNSHQYLLDIFGPGAPTPPTISVVRPADGASVRPAFPIEVDAEDNVKVVRVELYFDGAKVDETTQRPFVFNAPDHPGGPIEVEVRAVDNRDNTSSATVNVVQGEPCTQGSCTGGQVCSSGNCIDGPSSPGGLGSPCEGNGECDSALCADDGSEKRCTTLCGDGCPDGFRCRGDEAATAVCWPGDEGGGCAASPGDSPLPWSLVLGGLGLALCGVRPRRRRR
jgi:hypothetical protein